MIRDYVIVPMDTACIGYIQTGKRHEHGFAPTLDGIMIKLGSLGKFTYTIPDEIPFNKNQRVFEKKDNIYVNKLKKYYTDDRVQEQQLVWQTLLGMGQCR